MPTHRSSADVYRSVGALAVTLLIMAVLLFLPAGTFAWPRAWWLLALFVSASFVAVIYVWRVDPELFTVRRKPQAGTKGWDFAFVTVISVSITAILPIAGLDFRFNWSRLHDWAVWLGYLIFVTGYWLATWAQGVNRHFELTVRIQTDRGHKVIDTGPYSVIRHPGYIGANAMGIGIALALGSLVALIPAAICMITLALRTLAEEKTLRDGLPGYADYMQRVRYRWIPGIW